MQSIICFISPWYDGLGAICALIIAPLPVLELILNIGKSLTGMTFVVCGLGAITFNILPSISKNLTYSLPSLSTIVSSSVYPLPESITTTWSTIYPSPEFSSITG